MGFPARALTTVGILVGTAVLAAHADTFTYSLTADGGEFTFGITSPTLIATDTLFTVGQSCRVMFFDDCRALDLNPILGRATYQIYVHNQLGFSPSLPIPAVDFLAPGVYSTPDYPGTFSIIDNPSMVTPEPLPLVLLGTGAVGLFAALQRRYFKGLRTASIAS